jgi:hypothetical protein
MPESPERRLPAPWGRVQSGLVLARAGAIGAVPFFVLFLLMGLLALPLATPAERAPFVHALWVLAAVHLLPAAVHGVGHTRCLGLSDTHGGQMAASSWVLFLVGGLSLSGLFLPGGEVLVAAAFAVLALAGFAAWLAFLAALARSLGDAPLAAEVRLFAPRFWFGVAGAVALLCGAWLAERVGARTLVVFGWAGAGVVGLWLLAGYIRLLRTAAEAVTRRVTPVPDR